MIRKLELFFQSLSIETVDTAFSEQQLQLASAALLVEVATIDEHFSTEERLRLKSLLTKQCELSEAESEELITDAVRASSDSASLYDFTQLINRHFSEGQKNTLVENLWHIAYADGELDKYEEHIIRRIADLIHVRHQEFIKAKIKARDNQ